MVVPLEIFLRRRGKEREQPGGVGAQGTDDVVGVDDVALGLRHLRAVLDDHALAQQRRERLVHLDHAEVAQDLRVEARVEQVQHRVLDAADVLVDGHPVLGGAALEHALVVPRRAVAQEVPGRLDEGVHRVGLTPRLAAALGTRGVDERGDLGERRAALARELHVAREHDGQVLLVLRHQAVLIAVQHGDRRSPVPLAADAPVAQPIVHLGHPKPALDEPVDGLALGLGDGEAVEKAGVDLDPVASVRLAHPAVRALHGLDDRQPVLLCELPVALVFARHGHDGPGAVAHEDVVGDEQRDLGVAERVHDVRAEA